MEGPSIVIACEEFRPFEGKKVDQVSGNAKIELGLLKGKRFLKARSWGKHFLLSFEGGLTLKIHFLMWGSYRIDAPREDRDPRLEMKFGKHQVDFYTCSVRYLEGEPDEVYDWSADTMSPKWDPKKALEKVRKNPERMVSDVLMDQSIFAGVGNIIKNEVLYRLRIHPEATIAELTTKQLKDLVQEAVHYCFQFFEWKKKFELKKHWLIMRKKTCPDCGGKVTRRETGKGERLSHWCEQCQPRAARPVPKVARKKTAAAKRTRSTVPAHVAKKRAKRAPSPRALT